MSGHYSRYWTITYFRKHVTGRPSTEYVSEETPMAAYANLHIAFEQMRVRALRTVHGSPVRDDDPAASVEPPRVLVLGPENSGKTTVCKILANYAVRAGQGWSPLLTNVDPSEVGTNQRHPSLYFNLCVSSGWLVSTRRLIRHTRLLPAADEFSSQPFGVCSYFGSYYSIIQCVTSPCLLVWSCRNHT